MTANQEKCTKLLVQTVELKLKCPSNQMVKDPSIVAIVTANENQEDIRIDKNFIKKRIR